jgi:hypothetical protein
MHRIAALLALTLALAAIAGSFMPPAPTQTQTELARELPGNGDDDAET